MFRASCSVQLRGNTPAVAAPHACSPQQKRAQHQDVRTWGILDSYRRERGLLVDDAAEQKPKAAVQTPPKPKVESAHPAASVSLGWKDTDNAERPETWVGGEGSRLAGGPASSSFCMFGLFGGGLIFVGGLGVEGAFWCTQQLL